MPSVSNVQEGVLFINDDDTGTGDVTNSAISFIGGQLPVSAHFTCAVAYTNTNPFFNLFVQKDSPFTLKFELRNDSGPDDAKLRTIEFQQAKILDYIEVYDMNHQTFSGVNDLLVSFSIGAVSASIGDANFPAGS
jgi:hypothetical protein